MTTAAQERHLITSAIYDPTRNPYLQTVYTEEEILRKAAHLPSAVLKPWIEAIGHLQRIAWRLHDRDCDATAEPLCVGCRSQTPALPVVRPYFHPQQIEYICYDGREGWCITSKRWGKTDAGMFLVVARNIGYNPYTNEFYRVPISTWVVGLDFPMIRDKLVPAFMGFLPPAPTKWSDDTKAWDYKKTDLLATFFNGAVVGFKSADSGMTKFQSVDRDLIVFDEEIAEEIYTECKNRLPGGGRRLIIRGGMTPNVDLGLTWSYDKLYHNEARQSDPQNLRIWTGSMYENPGILRAAIDELAGDLEPYQRDVIIHGKYDVGKGRGAFDAVKLTELLLKKEPPRRVEQLTSGALSIWREPEPGAAYVIGVDTAQGLAHGDNSVAQVMKRTTHGLVHVASLVAKDEPDVFGADVVLIAKRYNNAWIVPETSEGTGVAATKAMRNTFYPYLYSQVSQEATAGKMESRTWGFNTNMLTRPIMVTDLRAMIRDGLLQTWDEATLKECATFIKGPDGKFQAQGSRKDDRVMALALAVQGHIRCPMPASAAQEQEAVAEEDEAAQRWARVRAGYFKDPEPVEDWVTA